MSNPRYVCWFSCGAASAVAAHFALSVMGEVEVVYCDTSFNEHPDNLRFFRDVEQWLGQKIERIKHPKFTTITDVFDSKQYMNGIKGAPCTVALKKVPRFAYQRPDDVHVFGMTIDESKRIAKFEHSNPELNLWWPLRDAGITKANTLEMLTAAGIDLPVLYKLGYKNNNCLGCVKATSPAYWNQVRKDFPLIFDLRAEQSRRIGCKLTRVKGKRIFLDQLAPDCTEIVEEDLSCGPQCSISDSTTEEE